MSWRPEGWQNPHKKPPGPLSKLLYHDIFEAGADAMLKLLKEKGAWMTPEQMKLLAPERQYGYGWIVFIPEEPK